MCAEGCASQGPRLTCRWVEGLPSGEVPGNGEWDGHRGWHTAEEGPRWMLWAAPAHRGHGGGIPVCEAEALTLFMPGFVWWGTDVEC